ncbi:MAG: Tad domain-containing protein [Gemmatales bacterium]|nr:Tad domain-containing protein [Gemmatales bacterium]MDW8386494.1 pilus assembly protein TadG-related protein [Gemmatales bacterium]
MGRAVRKRRGSVLPIVCLTCLGLLAFVALAVDVGVLAVARTQAQNVADSAAMAGARTLNGDKVNDNNLSAAVTAAMTAATSNRIMGKSVVASQVTNQFGSYSYNDSLQRFVTHIPRASNDNWSLCRSTVTVTGDTYFAKVFGISSFTTTTVATAVHRPRDIALVLDFSGSMRFDTLIGVPHSGARQVSGGSPASGTNNPEGVFPRFGAYSSISTAGLQRTSPVTISGQVYGLCNFTEVNPLSQNRNPIVQSFYQHNSGSSAALAFTPAADGDSEGHVAGDRHYRSNTATWPTYSPGSSYAQTIVQLLKLSSFSNSSPANWVWELDGYAAGLAGSVDGSANYGTGNASSTGGKTNYNDVPFAGYTVGPRYWGKTFFLWPPDPRWPFTSSSADRNKVRDLISAMGGLSTTHRDVVANNWPWSSETALANYLTTDPTGPLLSTNSRTYQRILRLHNRPRLDWRKRFFFRSDGATPMDDNSLLFDSDGDWYSPRVGSTTYYRINYQEILRWLFTEGPNPFPPRLKAGRINYYTALPNFNDNGLNNRWWNTYPLTDPNERFWKDYIDYVLGLRQTGASSWDTASSSVPNIVQFTGYGGDFTWGTASITPLSSLTGTPRPYMHYNDNPKRPRLHFWFGPMSMVDFLGNYNMAGRAANQAYWWWPGTAYEAPLYAAKIGVRAALRDIERNHPNDHVSLIMFCVPRTSATDTTNARRFNRVRAPLGRNYPRMIDSLWFPPFTLDNPGTEINMYEFEKNIEVPRAMGGTCYSMGLMLAYNQFSSNVSLRTYNPTPAPNGDAGGLGRRGAQKMVIFETDGLPNHTATAGFTNAGPYNSFYNIRFNSSSPGASEYPSVTSTADNSSAVTTEIFNICQRIVALDTDNPPGYSTARRPALIHCIGFGSVIAPDSSERAGAISTLGQMETIGNIPPSRRIGQVPYKLVYGDDAFMIETLRQAISDIMQDGVQVTLIE